MLVDGEQYRGDMVAYFAETMPGFAKGGLVRSYGNRYYHKPVMVGPVRWPGPMTVDWWRWTQSLTSRPVKGMLTGPYTLMDWSFDDHYPDRRTACLALAREVRKEVEALLEAGRPDHPDRRARALGPARRAARSPSRRCTSSSTACRPTTSSTRASAPSRRSIPGFSTCRSTTSIWRSRTAPSTSWRCSRRTRSPRTSRSGCSTSTATPWRRPATSKGRIRRGTSVLPADRIWVDPDCGLKTRTVEESRAKLGAMMAAVRAARAELG